MPPKRKRKPTKPIEPRRASLQVLTTEEGYRALHAKKEAVQAILTKRGGSAKQVSYRMISTAAFLLADPKRLADLVEEMADAKREQQQEMGARARNA